ncbi:unnamed protein product [Calypogeia fissa]
MCPTHDGKSRGADGDVVSEISFFDDATLEEIVVPDFGVALEEIATSSFQQISTNNMSIVVTPLEEDWDAAWVESLLSGDDEPLAYDIHEAYLTELSNYHRAARKGWQSVQCYRELVVSMEEKIAILTQENEQLQGEGSNVLTLHQQLEDSTRQTKAWEEKANLYQCQAKRLELELKAKQVVPSSSNGGPLDEQIAHVHQQVKAQFGPLLEAGYRYIEMNYKAMKEHGKGNKRTKKAPPPPPT